MTANVDYFTCTGRNLYPYFVEFREGYFLETDHSFTQSEGSFQQFKGHKLTSIEGTIFGGKAVINGVEVGVLSASGAMADKLAMMLWQQKAIVKVTRLDIKEDEARKLDYLLAWGLSSNPNLIKQYFSTGATFYIGGKNRFIRVYDKTAEAKLTVDVVRWECQLRADRANTYFGELGKLWLDGKAAYYAKLGELLNLELAHWGLVPLGQTAGKIQVAGKVKGENWLSTQIMPYLIKMLTGTEFERDKVMQSFNDNGLYLDDRLLRQDKLDEKLEQTELFQT